MPIKFLKTPEKLGEAAKAATSGRFSAVLLKKLVTNPADLDDEMNNAPFGMSINILRKWVDLEPLENAIDEWAERVGIEETEILVAARIKHPTSVHVDTLPNNRAFVLSLGMIGAASWKTQFVPGLQPTGDAVNFDPEIKIDRFTQKAGDAVFIPPYSIHEISAPYDRVSRLYVPQDANLTYK